MGPDFDASTLSYEPRPAWTGKGASLTQRDGEIVITFPLPNRWTIWANATGQLLFAISQLGNVLPLVWMMRWMPPSVAPPRSATVWAVLGLVTGALLTLEAVHTLRRYFRWGLISRTLTFAPETITDRWLGRNRMRERIRSTNDLKEIRKTVARDICLRRRIARIHVHFRTDFPRSILIPVESAQAADQMLNSLEGAIAARQENKAGD